MKRQKNTFNDLLRRYNKYRNKLFRLQESGRNEHRQSVLRKHIERLFLKLQSLQLSFKRKAVLAASFTAVMALSSQNANAQIEFHSFNPNPYSLTDIGSLSDTEFADLDGDGDFDLMAGNEFGEFQYFENIGTNVVPNFAPVQVNPFSLASIPTRSSNSFADLDNDGDLDIISGNLNGDLTYFENIGTVNVPVFAVALSNPFSLTAVGSNAKPDFVDLDGDGDFDIMVGDWNGDLTYFENTGTVNSPSYGAAQINPFLLFNVSGGFQNPDFADLDNDGDLDMMCGRANGQFYVYLNNGTVSVPWFALMPTNWYNTSGLTDGYSSPAFADLDNDGDFDLISGNSIGKFHYFKNEGTIVAPFFSDQQTNLFSLTSVLAFSNPSFGDLDGDGDLDMISGENSGGFHYFENIGTNLIPDYATVQTDPFSLTNIGGGSTPEFVDLDNDGDLDIVSGGGTNVGAFRFFENIGSPTIPNFGVVQINPFSLTSIGNQSDPTFADLDGDGDFDLVAGVYDGSFHYFENIGSSSAPSFGVVQINPFSLTGITSYRSSPTFADLDNDGDFDLLSGEYYTNFKYFENTGTASVPSFGSGQINPFTLTGVSGNYSSAPAFADLDADGDMDLMVGYAAPGYFKYFENISACGVNIGVSLVGITLTADQNNATYQWVDCDNANAPVVGETNQSFTPTANGNYACAIDLVVCNDITNCVAITTVGIDELNSTMVNIYPNPATDQITISSAEMIEEVIIFNMYGELVQQETSSTFSVGNLSNGVYIMNIKTKSGMVRNRLIKE